ncbi:MAG: fibronectin type III domain-containing protein, partial [Clostridium perfringens]|nr:fibronectin type III domain-containing protein [Clostridium perfringens]
EGKKKSFKDIYEILEGTSHGFGMRKGIIPIYLTVVLSGFKDEIILYTGERTLKEVPLNSNTINNINENPNMYFIEIDKGTKEKDEYFLGLEKLFEASNIIKTNKYERVVYAMQDWIKSLDKFTRIHELKFNSDEKIDRDIVKLRKELLKYDINIRSFIFVDLPNICGTEDLYEALKRLNEIKYYLDNRCIKVKYELSNITKNKLTLDYNGSLSQSIKLWINSLQQYKKDYLYDVVTNKLIEYGKELSTNNEEIIIDQLSVILTGLTIGDWNDTTIKSYLETLDTCLEKIKDLEAGDIVSIFNDKDSIFPEKVSVPVAKGGDTAILDRISINPEGGVLTLEVKSEGKKAKRIEVPYSGFGEIEMKIENEAPTNLRTVDVQKKSVSLAWDSPENTYGLEGYIIYKDNKKVGEVSADETEFTVGKLNRHTIYNFKVAAKYSNGEISKRDTITVRTAR